MSCFEILELEDLNTIIKKTAKTIPFENLSIINSSSSKITPENLIKKIIERNEGGLCYELNSLFYYFTANVLSSLPFEKVLAEWGTGCFCSLNIL
ncbi:arylamine N-acetyltransferase [Paenibacillus terrae]|uniref:arylamine N-acetyltransferase n=1 Tax=Paenibacillus terrae TaxID=159743 RepID=UPI0009E64509